jgi:fluoride exporter
MESVREESKSKNFIQNSIAVLIGGFIGCNIRYFLSIWVHQPHIQAFHGHSFSKFPLAIFVINMLGSFIIGFLQVCFKKVKEAESTKIFNLLESLILVGLLGGLTTVSSFILDTVNLFEAGYLFIGLINIFASVVFGFIFCLIGVYLAKRVI